jgi:hypothetical protein
MAQQVFVAPKGYAPDNENPFTPDGRYGRSWTILKIDSYFEGVLYQQCTCHGCYEVTISPQYSYFYELIADFIQYESEYNRKILLVAERDINLEFSTNYKERIIRPSDPRYLIHSTTLARYEKIVADGLLKSPNRLKNEGCPVKSIGLKPLCEPEDYLDYIMFAKGGVAPELVVNSHLCGIVNYDPFAQYTPQVRLYFDGYKMVTDGLIVRNVTSMAYDNVPLRYLVKAVTADDLKLPDGDANWTPFAFSEAADIYMRQYITSQLP